jgi:hypothetical protein
VVSTPGPILSPIQFRVGGFHTMKRKASLIMADSAVTWTNYLLGAV